MIFSKPLDLSIFTLNNKSGKNAKYDNHYNDISWSKLWLSKHNFGWKYPLPIFEAWLKHKKDLNCSHTSICIRPLKSA